MPWPPETPQPNESRPDDFSKPPGLLDRLRKFREDVYKWLAENYTYSEPGIVDKSIKPTLENTFQEVEITGDPGHIFPEEPEIWLLEEKPLPKVVTIEVSGLPGTGKTMLLQLIDNIIQEKIGVVPICAELEDESNLINLNEIPQWFIDYYKSGRIIIEMKQNEIKPTM